MARSWRGGCARACPAFACSGWAAAGWRPRASSCWPVSTVSRCSAWPRSSATCPISLRIRREVYATLERERVDLVVPIDYPGFNLPLAGRAHDLDIRVLYYIAPQVWAWKERRAARLARWCDEICVVLPFEAELLESYGAPRAIRRASAPRPARQLPGGRAARPRAVPGVAATGSGADAPGVHGRRRAGCARRVSNVRFSSPGRRIFRPEAYAGCPPELLAPAEEVMARARAAITKSGTITLQLAIADVPMVVGYRMHGADVPHPPAPGDARQRRAREPRGRRCGSWRSACRTR